MTPSGEPKNRPRPQVSARTRERARALLALLFMAGIFTAIYPPFSLTALAWVATAPAAALAGGHWRAHPWQAAALGLLFGQMAATGIVAPWMYPAAVDFFDWSRPMAAIFTFAVLFTHVALYYGLLAAALTTLTRFGALARILGGACLWTAAESVRAHTLFGNPWAALGQALPSASAAALAAIGGTPLATWVAAASGLALGTAAVAATAGQRRQSLAMGLGLVALVQVLPCLPSARMPPELSPRGALRVAMVEPSIVREELWNPMLSRQHLERYLRLSRSPEIAGADLVVWPENAVPFLLDADAAALEKIRRFGRETGSALLLGAGRTVAAEGRASLRNAAWWFAAGGHEPETYDKRRLLPYIEATPSWIARALPDRWGMPYDPGRGAALWQAAGWKVAPLVCFEAIYPPYAREAVVLGADLIVNLTNDSWFDRAGGPGQHFAAARLRAAETGRPMVRVASGGVSTVLDGWGKEIAPLVNTGEVALWEIQPHLGRPLALRLAVPLENAIALAGLAFVAIALGRRD